MPNSPLTQFIVLPPRPQDYKNGLGGWWTFDDGTAQDYSGASNPGTLTGTTLPKPIGGIINNALTFDGSTGYVNVPDSTRLNLYLSGLTMMAWVKASALTNAYSCVMKKGDNTNSFAGFVKSTGKLALYQLTAGVSRADDGAGNTALVTGVWYHLAFTVDSTNRLSFYINGSLDGTNQFTSQALPSTSGLALTIGNDTGTASRFWNGQIDDARWYNLALTGGEVNAVYRAGVAFQQGQPELDLPVVSLATLPPINLAGALGGVSSYG